MTINGEQIRVARAVLDWSAADLARECGLAVNSINKIEREKVVPQKSTLMKIQKVLEDAGLEFMPFSGVKRKEQMVHVWKGTQAPDMLLEDIHKELHGTESEILISGVNEKAFLQTVGKEKVDTYIDLLKREKISERLLIKEGDKNFVASHESYHVIPEKYFSANPFMIYGSKLAVVVWSTTPKVIVIDDGRIAESLRKLFNFVWENTKPP